VLDADLQYDPQEIARLWGAQQATGADIVQGTRTARERRPDLRYLLSRSLNTLLNRTFDMSLQDNKSGFFLCRREVLEMLLEFRRHFRHWQCFVMVAAHHHGLTIHQVETPFRPRSAGRSAFGRIPICSTVGVALDLLTALSEYPRTRA
jgi:phenylacetate-CoA ligase